MSAYDISIHLPNLHYHHSHSNCAQEERRYQSRTELASRVGSVPFTETPVHASSAMKSDMLYSSSVPVKVTSQVSDVNSLTPSVDSGYKSSSYQTLASSLSGVRPQETSSDVTKYIGQDGSETTIRNTTERRKKTVQIEAVQNKDGSFHYPAIPVTQWKGDSGSKAIDQSPSSQHQPRVNIRVNPYEEVDSFLPRPGDSSKTSSSLQKHCDGQSSTISSGNLRSPTSAFVPLTVSTSMGEHLYDTSIHSSSSSSSTSSIPTAYYSHHHRNNHNPHHQSQRNPGSGNHPGSGYHPHSNQSQQYIHTQQSSSNNSQQYQSTTQKGSSMHPSQVGSSDWNSQQYQSTPQKGSSMHPSQVGSRDWNSQQYQSTPQKGSSMHPSQVGSRDWNSQQYQSTPQKGSSMHPSQVGSRDREIESFSHASDTSSREVSNQPELTPSQHLLKSAFRKADFLLSPSSIPSLSRPIPIPIQNERPKVSFHDQREEHGSGLPTGSFQRVLSPEVEQPPRASSVPPTLPSYDWVMNRIRELRRGTNNVNQKTSVGSKGYSNDRAGESKLDSSQKVGSKVHFDLRNEVISSSLTPRGHVTNQSKTNVVQPIPQRPVRPQFENLATLPPKGNTRSRTPQEPQKHQTNNLREMVSNNVPNRREEIERWNNYGYSYNNSSMQETGQTLPGSTPASQSFVPTSPMQQKVDGERSPSHYHIPEQRLPEYQPYQQQTDQQPTQTERKVRTLNKQTLHVESTNPSQSVTFNTTHPPLSSMHGSTPPQERVFTRSVSNSGLNELETNNNNSSGEDAFSSLDDAVKMLSHWSNEIQKLSAPYKSPSSIDANHNTHASLDNSAILSHHQLNNNNQSDDRINPSHFQTHQSNGGYHYTSQTLTNHRPQATSTPRKNFDEVDLHIDEPTEVDNIPKGLVADRSPSE